jgi:protein transport protein SEC31
MGLAWSAHDPSLLLSSAKDSRNICWDVNTTDILCELPASANWNHDVQWCPNIPGEGGRDRERRPQRPALGGCRE